MSELTHLRADGSAHMVDVTDKSVTRREATAQAVLQTTAEVVARIADGSLPKGEALGTAAADWTLARNFQPTEGDDQESQSTD